MISEDVDTVVLDDSSTDSADSDSPHEDTDPLDDSCSIPEEEKAENIKAMLQTLSVDVEMSSVFICRFCGTAFQRKQDCNQHERSSHSELVDIDLIDEFPCKQCKRVYASNESLERHVRETHSGNEASEVSSHDENVSNAVNVSSSSRKRPRLSNNNNKENVISQLTPYQKGYVISYLGKPRFLFPNPESKAIEKRNNQLLRSYQICRESQKKQKNNDSPLTLGKNGIQNPLTNNHNAIILKLEELCRLCGAYNERRVSVFSDTKCNFSKMIQDYFPRIEISKDDILPTQICVKCETTLSTWYQFHKDCNAANIRFQAMLKMLMAEPDVKQKLAAKRSREEDADSDDSDCERLDDDHDDENEDSSDNEKSTGPKEVELIDVRPDIPNIFADDSLTALERRRIKQRMRARVRLHRLKQKPSACTLCEKSFNLPETLRRHMSTVHSNEKPYKCHLCSTSYNRNHYLTTHIKNVHEKKRQPIERSAEPPHLCDYCGKELASARSLQVHINCVHTKEQSFECDNCHVTFYQRISLQNHLGRNQCTTLRQNNGAKECEEGFPKTCEICGLEFKTEIFFTKHQMKHMTSLTCTVCSVVLDDLHALKEHLELEHPEMTPFQCEVCGKRFKTKNFLQKHAIIHTGEKRFQCEYCSIKFLKKKYLINHVRRHTGERPFVCNVCDRAFTQVSEMRIHKARHKLATQS